MYKQSLQQYRKPPQAGNPRQTEAWALTEAAIRMQAAKDAGDLDAMMSNARLNWKLWTIFQSELLDPHCPVPEDIRTNVLTLANFVDRQTVDFLTRRQPELLDILITIDRNLAMGLYAEVTDATPGATAAVAGLEKGISA